MDNLILNLTKELITLKTIPENPDQLSAALDLCLKNISVGTVETFERNGAKSILVYNREHRPDRFRVILNGHLDVIPGKPSQYSPVVKGDRLYGVGATDMKANVACIISVFNAMANEVSYPLALQLVTEEELGGFDGTKYQIEAGVRADFVIAAESTNFDVVNQAKGVLWVKLTCTGVTAHGAYPWRGENAIQKMNRFLVALEGEFPTPREQIWGTTVNVSAIKSNNQSYNKIPDHCEVNLDIRFLPNTLDDVLRQLKSIVPDDFSFEIVANEPALYVDSENIFLNKLKSATERIRAIESRFYCAQGSSDARHYTRVGDAGVEFGPIGGGIGTDEEWIDIPSLKTYCEVLKQFLQDVSTL